MKTGSRPELINLNLQQALDAAARFQILLRLIKLSYYLALRALSHKNSGLNRGPSFDNMGMRVHLAVGHVNLDLVIVRQLESCKVESSTRITGLGLYYYPLTSHLSANLKFCP